MDTTISEHNNGKYPQASDDQLLSEARSGDQRAFAELCLRYSGMLRQRIYTIVRNREDAEDVLQDTMLSAYRHLDTFRGTCRVSSWMMRIGINRALMLLRKRRSSPEFITERFSEDGLQYESPEFRDPGLNPEQRYIKEQAFHNLHAAMQRLPARTRSLMDLYYRKERHLKDAAETLGINVSTAKSRILRARHQLQRSLKQRAS